jgi:hypothetical protein
MSEARPATAPEPISASVARRRIAVVPARLHLAHARLFAALEAVFPVTFDVGNPQDLRNADGVLVLDGTHMSDLPAGVHILMAALRHPSAASDELIRFTSEERVDHPLRSRALRESIAHGEVTNPFSSGDCTLASVGGRPVWWWRGDIERSEYVTAFPLSDLREGETLRDHLRAGRFMGLVPLLRLLRDLCGGLECEEPSLRASFVLDDPNLHRTSYGFVSYRELVREASMHGYHVGLGMVPFDGWLVNRDAARMVRVNPASVSLLVHGNDHVARELGRLECDRDAEVSLGQALRRVTRFERRSGVSVKRVMVPPHGACSEAALRAMFRLGFDAACISRPYPWRDGMAALSPIVGWNPAELVAGGIPILPRLHISSPREELIFRALLRQPLILYGHHWDLADGLDVLAQAASEVDALGDVQWGPLDWVAKGCRSTRREGDTLHVQMHSRSVLIDVPEGVTTVRAHTGEVHGGPAWGQLVAAGAHAPMVPDLNGWTSEPLEVHPHTEIELSLPPARPLHADALPPRAANPWVITRRILVEARDRLRPLTTRTPTTPTARGSEAQLPAQST